MYTERQSTTLSSAAEAEARARRAFAVVALVMAGVLLVYWPTTLSMVETWARSETYKHCFLVIPTVLWFVWQSRAQLASAPVAPWWPALIPLAGAGSLWLVGDLASALAPTQWAVVLMVPLSVLALFGIRWGQILAFPMAFLLFAVPFGEAFTPVLIDWTADFTVAALRAVGVPLLREGQHFVIPSGQWSVVEACSGIRYLMASVVAGTLYAWTLYRSALRRILFIAASVAVPIVANWMRAFLIVMLGHLSSNRLAVGVDHLIYGWVFFGMVIGLMFWVGARWREDDKEEECASSLTVPAASGIVDAPLRPPASMVALVVAVMVAGPLVAQILGGVTDERPIEAAPVEAAGPWLRADTPASNWVPQLQGQVLTQVVSFVQGDTTVTAAIAWYRNQRQGRELVNAMNRLVPTAGVSLQIAGGSREVQFGEEASTVRTATIRHGGKRLRIWYWYRVDDRIETSDMRAKLSLALDRLLMRSDTSAWVALFVEAETDAEGDRTLAAFARDIGQSLNTALSATSAR